VKHSTVPILNLELELTAWFLQSQSPWWTLQLNKSNKADILIKTSYKTKSVH